MRLKVLGKRHGIAAVTLHAQVQRLHALQDEKCVERRQRGADVAKQHRAGPADVGRGPEGIAPHHAVVARIGLGEAREAVAVGHPVKVARIDHDAADRGAMATDKLGERVHHDVGAVLKRTAQDGSGHRVVHDERHAHGVRGVGPGTKVNHVQRRVAERLHEHRAGVLVGQFGDRLGVVALGEAHFDAELRQRVGEQVVGTAVQLRLGDDVVAGAAHVEYRVGNCSLTGCQSAGGDAALQLGDALLQHIPGGVHDSGVDVARLGKREQVRGVLGIVEDERGRLVDRHGPCIGGRVGCLTPVKGNGVAVLLAHEVVSPWDVAVTAALGPSGPAAILIITYMDSGISVRVFHGATGVPGTTP